METETETQPVELRYAEHDDGTPHPFILEVGSIAIPMSSVQVHLLVEQAGNDLDIWPVPF